MKKDNHLKLNLNALDRKSQLSNINEVTRDFETSRLYDFNFETEGSRQPPSARGKSGFPEFLTVDENKPKLARDETMVNLETLSAEDSREEKKVPEMEFHDEDDSLINMGEQRSAG